MPPLERVNSSPQWASEIQVAVATVALDADGEALADTFYPYYGSTTRKNVVPTAPNTFQSEFRPYAIVQLSQDRSTTAINTPDDATTDGAQVSESTGQDTAYAVVPGMHVTAEQIQEGSFVLRAAVNGYATAPVNFAVVEGAVATGVLSTVPDPRTAILCALGVCVDSSESAMWPEGSIVATGTMSRDTLDGACQLIFIAAKSCGCSARSLKPEY